MESRKIDYYIRKHNYLVVSFVALIATIWLTLRPQGSIATLQILSLLSLGFLGWSLLHHFFDKSLKTEVIIEYLVTVGLVMVILLSFVQ
ncbi:MAG: hypothetical protein Q7R49_04805 [Candidatus Daviesbacteria bacterium]|nr:hypothetical protein [Candidatus Daviesbacteria bacterium]